MSTVPTGPETQPQTPASEDGFTLVEMLVTMSIAVVVLFAILQGAEFLDRTTAASSRLTDAQENGRRALRGITTEARQATTTVAGHTTPLEAVSRSSIVFSTAVDTSTTTEIRWVRYCATSDNRLLRGQRTAAPSAAQNASACGSAGNGWTYATVLQGTLADGARLFSFTASASYVGGGCPQQPITATTPNPPACLPAPESVTGVGIRLAVADRATAATKTVVTRGAVSFRNRSQL